MLNYFGKIYGGWGGGGVYSKNHLEGGQGLPDLPNNNFHILEGHWGGGGDSV